MDVRELKEHLEELSLDKSRSAFDCGSCGIEANLIQDTIATLEALNKVYLAAKGIRPLVETMNMDENLAVQKYDAAIEELEGRDE